jgi:MFS family permease
MNQSFKKYGTLLSLYLAQSIPMSFFSTVVPVIMRQEDYSLTSIGLIQLIKIPWILKFLWAPIVDHTSPSRKHYRRWILGSEVFYAMVIILISFFNLSSDFTTIIILVVIAFIASGTQDIATDAFAILTLKTEERSYGNSMQSGGSFLGTTIGSGVLLMAYYYVGWQALLLLLAFLVTMALMPVTFARLPIEQATTTPKRRPKWDDGFSFFKQRGNLRHLLLLFVYYSGIIGLLAMFKPFMVDQGYTAKEIGMISGIYGTAVGAVFSLGGGWIIRRVSRITALQVILLSGFLSSLFFVWMMHGQVPLWGIYFASSMVWGTYGMASVFIYTIAMDKVRKGLEGSDFTIQIVITHLSSLFLTIGLSKFANTYGYHGMFILEAHIGIVLLVLSRTLFRKVVEK